MWRRILFSRESPPQLWRYSGATYRWYKNRKRKKKNRLRMPDRITTCGAVSYGSWGNILYFCFGGGVDRTGGPAASSNPKFMAQRASYNNRTALTWQQLGGSHVPQVLRARSNLYGNSSLPGSLRSVSLVGTAQVLTSSCFLPAVRETWAV